MSSLVSKCRQLIQDARDKGALYTGRHCHVSDGAHCFVLTQLPDGGHRLSAFSAGLEQSIDLATPNSTRVTEWVVRGTVLPIRRMVYGVFRQQALTGMVYWDENSLGHPELLCFMTQGRQYPYSRGLWFDARQFWNLVGLGVLRNISHQLAGSQNCHYGTLGNQQVIVYSNQTLVNVNTPGRARDLQAFRGRDLASELAGVIAQVRP